MNSFYLKLYFQCRLKIEINIYFLSPEDKKLEALIVPNEKVYSNYNSQGVILPLQLTGKADRSLGYYKHR